MSYTYGEDGRKKESKVVTEYSNDKHWKEDRQTSN